MESANLTQIGTIINSHGIKGEVKVMPITEDGDLIHRLDRLIIDDGGQQKLFNVLRARAAKNCWLIQFDEVRDMDAAKSLKGAGICVDDSELKPLDEDEFFIHDLISAKVYSTDDEYLGVITGFFEAGSQGVCEVTDESGMFLFPTSQEVLKEIVPGEKVIINLLPGLRDLNR
jgi:16S rRNA processing protein RimM